MRRFSYTAPGPSDDDEGTDLEVKWREWVLEESYKRFVDRVQCHTATKADHLG